MIKNIKLLTVSALSFFSVSFAYAGSYSVEARGDAMGGVGVVSGTYLTAPFYNPALVAIYRRNDDAGMILPSIGLNYDDQDKLMDSVDNISDIIKAVEGGDTSQESNLAAELDAMDGSQAKVEVGLAAAIGIPNQYLSMTLFGKVYAETFVTPDVANDADTLTRAQNTTIDAVSVAVSEAGVNVGKYMNFLGQHMAIGISPKVQRIYTYVYQASVNNFDLTDVDENDNYVNHFNIDAGLLWFYGPVRVGISGRNLIAKDIQTNTFGSSSQSYQYKLEPQYTLGVGLVADYATISVDYDLNELERYVAFNDNTQMLRVGGEIDIMRQLKLRAGYMKNLAYSNSEDTVTAGIGLSPLGLFEIDIAGSYTNEDAMGAYVNFLATY
ncbi:conjugal transfer protein TraF [Vibrio salinus]|uniref:conjugal transfer protein TraF n=1 Tax=Vibrio salinus TaxID=2899784 RepID=UPI001E4274C2|nr:conjugal transfer protein TraF [Vibrio salinus]MCE0495811.1 conjugal transfer protein TraF [Vibrio salinus]